jgi:beta-glucuronidase
MMNEYFGSWHGAASELAPALDNVERLFPSKMAIISEFGFPGVFANDPVEADRTRTQILRQQLPELARRDWIGGAILWCYQDYKSRRNLWPGQQEGYVEHGVVDEKRQRKPSYAVWEALNLPANITASWTSTAGAAVPAGFIATIVPNAETSLPYRALRDFQLAWQILDHEGKRIAGAQQSLGALSGAFHASGVLPAGANGHAFTLVLSLLTPAGAVAAERRLIWPEQAGGSVNGSSPR